MEKEIYLTRSKYFTVRSKEVNYAMARLSLKTRNDDKPYRWAIYLKKGPDSWFEMVCGPKWEENWEQALEAGQKALFQIFPDGAEEISYKTLHFSFAGDLPANLNEKVFVREGSHLPDCFRAQCCKAVR